MANETVQGEALQTTAALDPATLRRDFETAWKNGRPEIRDYLILMPDEEREELFCELLEVEFAARRQIGELPALDEYRRRFESYATAVERQYNRFVKPHELQDYKILGLLGRGGMGVVYKAQQVQMSRTVALKVLSDRLVDDEQSVARFKREIQMTGRLSHPNILLAHDARMERGIYFLVTEFVEGICVSDLIKRDGRIGIADACEIVRQVAGALEYARSEDVVHRDIKPSNLMITPAGLVKILDFGLARLQADLVEQQASRQVTTPGRAIGTLDYMAPEQYEDASSVDHRADIYSLGCTMYHLLVGQPPFGGPKYSSMIAKMRAHALAPTPKVTDQRGDVPPAVAAIVERMMAKHKNERFQTPGEVAAAVEPFAAGAGLSRLASDPEKTQAEVIKSDSPTVKVTNQPTDPASTTASATWTSAVLKKAKAHKRALAAAVGGLVVVAVFWTVFHRPAEPAIPFATAIATLPGLDNNDDYDWWFNEMPWLIPQSRERLAKWAGSHGPSGEAELTALTTNINATSAESLRQLRNSLKTWSSAPPLGDYAIHPDLLPFESLAALLEDEPRNNKSHLKQLDKVIEALVSPRGGPTAPITTASATEAIEALGASDCHLLAVVLHKKATLSPTTAGPEELGREQAFALAEQAYQSALKKYSASSNQLAILCQSDLGAMYFDRGDNDSLAKAKVRFRLVGHAENSSPLSRVYGLCRYAGACAQLKEDEETVLAALSEAERIARNELPKDHPLFAFVFDCKGWAAMDYLHYDRAEEYFPTAAAIRGRIGQDNSEATIHDRHGAALAHQYRAIFSGAELSDSQRRRHLAESHGEFDKVIEKSAKLIEDADSANGNVSAQQRLNRFERHRNALDRDADGYLFGDHNYAQAQTIYGNCLDFLKKHHLDDGPKAAEASATRTKLAMAQALLENVAAARVILDQVDASPITKTNDSLVFASMIARSLCDLLAAKGKVTPEIRAAVVTKLAAQYAKKMKDQGRDTPGLLRDEQLALNLLLFVASDQKLNADALEQARKLAAADTSTARANDSTSHR